MNAASPMPLADVYHKPINRHTTALDGIDWVYGSSPCASGRLNWGLPGSSVSLWAGAAGTGKSRLAVAIVSRMSLEGRSILISQNEVNPSQLKSWFAGQNHNANRIHVLDRPSLDDLLQVIRSMSPALVVVDSASMLEGIERQATARRVIADLRAAAETTGSHIVLVGHLNSRGQVKGGTTLPHLVDTVAILERGELNGWVRFGIHDKHRFGPTGRYVMLTHGEQGLKILFSGDEQFPIMQVRFDPSTGRAVRKVPVPGSGGKEVEIDDCGCVIRCQSWLQRVLAGS